MIVFGLYCCITLLNNQDTLNMFGAVVCFIMVVEKIISECIALFWVKSAFHRSLNLSK